MRTLRSVTVLAFVWVAIAGVTARAQVNPYPPPAGQTPSGRNPSGMPEPPDLPPTILAEQARSRNVQRQKQLEADAAKLLSLATELKQQVDKTNQNVMSLDVIKKAAEIEKLAKSVKDRMKGES